MSIAEEEREGQGSNEPTREQCLLDATGCLYGVCIRWQQRKLVIAGVLCWKAIALEDRFPGTLPVNAYEEESGPTEIFNMSQLQNSTLPSSLHEETSTSENREQETTSAVAKKGDLRLWYMATHQKDWPQNPVLFLS